MPPIAPRRISVAGSGSSAVVAACGQAALLVLAIAACADAASLPPTGPPPRPETPWERVAVDTAVVVPSGDAVAVWSRTIDEVAAAGFSITRAIQPDATAAPPRPGTIESAWVQATAGSRGPTWPHWPTAEERFVVNVVPTSAGVCILGVVERRSAATCEPDYAPLPAEFMRDVVRVAHWDDAPAGEPTTPIPDDGFYVQPVFEESLAPRADPPWTRSAHPRLSAAAYRVTDDYLNFYGCRSLAGIGIATGAAAIMANTNFDATVQATWQRRVSPTGVGAFLSGCRDIGDGAYALPVFGAAATLGLFGAEHPACGMIGEWGGRSLRTFIVGAPLLLIMQEATGASRPGESSAGSRWHSFADNNGVSGHAFIGAIPFLAAAGMAEAPLLKGTLYVCSTFVALSRVTDDAHYPSQAFLGWYLALAAAQAVETTEARIADMEFRVVPLAVAGLDGLAVETRW